MVFGRVRRSAVVLVLLIFAFIPTATAAVTTESQKSPAIEYADTTACPGNQPTGLILYVTTPDDPTTEHRELIVAEPNGTVVRRIDVRNPRLLFPANQPGKAFVYTFDADLYLVNAFSGAAKKLFKESNEHPAWPWGRYVNAPPVREWQVLYGEEKRDSLLVNLNTGEVLSLPARIDGVPLVDVRNVEISPDGEYVVIQSGLDLFVGDPAEMSSLHPADSDVIKLIAYSPDGGTLYYQRSLDLLKYELVAKNLRTGSRRILIGPVRNFLVEPIPDTNRVLVSVDIEEHQRTRISEINLMTGRLSRSITFDGGVPFFYPSPDGEKVVFPRYTDNSMQWMVADLGSGSVMAMNRPEELYVAEQKPGQRWIATYRAAERNPWMSRWVKAIDLRTGNLIDLAPWQSGWSEYSFEDYSDDGRFSVLLVGLDNGTKRFIVRDNSGGPNQVLSEGEEWGAMLSPDDCWVVYSSYQQNDHTPDNSLHIVRTGGGAPMRIAEGMYPVWIQD